MYIVETNKKKESTLGRIYAILVIITMTTLISSRAFSFYSSLSFFLYLAVVILSLFYKKIYSKKWTMFISIVLIYFFGVTLFNEKAGIGSAILISISMLFISNIKDAIIPGGFLSALKGLCLLFFIYMVFISFNIHADYIYYANNFINPNTWAEFIMYISMLYTVLNSSEKRVNIVNIAILFIAIVGMYNCRTRLMTLASILYLVLYIFPYRFFKKNRLFLFAVIIIVVGTIFPFLYLCLYRSGFKMMIYGKDIFSGREYIWNVIFEALNENKWRYLIGLGSHAELANLGGLNVHNLYLTLIVDFGVIGYLLYFLYILYIVSYKSKKINSEISKDALLMFIVGNLFLGFSETSLLWSAVFSISCIGLANTEEKILYKKDILRFNLQENQN